MVTSWWFLLLWALVVIIGSTWYYYSIVSSKKAEFFSFSSKGDTPQYPESLGDPFFKYDMAKHSSEGGWKIRMKKDPKAADDDKKAEPLDEGRKVSDKCVFIGKQANLNDIDCSKINHLRLKDSPDHDPYECIFEYKTGKDGFDQAQAHFCCVKGYDQVSLQRDLRMLTDKGVPVPYMEWDDKIIRPYIDEKNNILQYSDIKDENTLKLIKENPLVKARFKCMAGVTQLAGEKKGKSAGEAIVTVGGPSGAASKPSAAAKSASAKPAAAKSAAAKSNSAKRTATAKPTSAKPTAAPKKTAAKPTTSS